MAIFLTSALSLLAGLQGPEQGGAPPPASKPARPAAQKPQASDLQKKYEDKLKEPFLKKAPWITDYDKALAEAKKTGKMVFGYFSRSYAY